MLKHFMTITQAVLLLLIIQSPAQAAGEQTVWDYWYTVTVNQLPAQFYNEKVVMHEDKLQFLSHVWKKEEGYVNEEQLGAFAKADENLTPLFFNFRSTYRTSETIVDGNIREGKTLVASVRRNNEKLPSVTKSVPSKTFFSVFFPVWLRKVLPTLKEGRSLSFSTLLEDDIEHGFETESGTIRLEKADEFASRTHTSKISVDYRSVKSLWWVDKSGAPLRTIMPESNAVIERVSKDKAEAFLK